MTEKQIAKIEKETPKQFLGGTHTLMKKEDIDAIEEKLGYHFNEPCLLIQAFTRSSFVEENLNYLCYEDNEKLEFVGDKFLDMIVVKRLTEIYGKLTKVEKPVLNELVTSVGQHPMILGYNLYKGYKFALTEGEMTEMKKQVVQTSFLSAAIERMGLECYLIMGKNDQSNNVSDEPSVKEDLFEAIIGAIAIDSSFDMKILESVIERLLDLDEHLKGGVDDGVDYVSKIQNWYQKEYHSDPIYEFLERDDDAPFECSLYLKGFSEYFDGYGRSKKEAIRLAAKRAWSFIEAETEKGNKLLDAIGSFDCDNSVGKLEELKNKKLISGLEYIFREGAPSESSNGNPLWYCECRVNGMDEFVECCDAKKMKAKKDAAYCALTILTTGQDKVIEIMKEYGKEVTNNGRN